MRAHPSSIEVNLMVVIRSKRLLLQEFRENDWQKVHSYASDPEVVRYMDWGPNAEEETKAFISRSISSQKEKPRKRYTLAITLKEENKLIGSCDLCVESPENKEGWIGYCLNRQFWRRGYATETAQALNLAFSSLACIGYLLQSTQITSVPYVFWRKLACNMKVTFANTNGQKADGATLYYTLYLRMNGKEHVRTPKNVRKVGDGARI